MQMLYTDDLNIRPGTYDSRYNWVHKQIIMLCTDVRFRCKSELAIQKEIHVVNTILMTQDGNTALHFAAGEREESNLDLCLLLIENGAKVSLPNKVCKRMQ